MPMFTYTPDWDKVREFFAKMSGVIPKDYTGKLAIRLHRTGNPLTLELFGPELPDRPLYPLILLEMEDGDLKRDLNRIKDQHEVPWVKFEDFKRYGENVMEYYHQEDLLEPAAEAVLKIANPPDDVLRKALVDHAASTARS